MHFSNKLLLAVATAAGLALGACGSDDDTTGTPEPAGDAPATEQAATAEETPTPVPEPTPTPGETGPPVIWEFDAGEGASTLAVAEGETVVIAVVNGDQGALVGLDAASGEERWREDLQAAPTVPGLREGVAAVATTDGTVHAFDSADGEPLWSYEAGSAPGQVAVSDGLVIAADARPGQFGLPSEPAGERQGWTEAIGIESGDQEWLMLGGAPATIAMTVVDGVIYTASTPEDGGTATVAAIDATSGEQAWRTRLAEDTASYPAVTGAHVVVASDELFALSREDGEIEWTFDVEGESMTAAAAGDGMVAAASGALDWYLLDAASGNEVAAHQYCDCPWLGAIAGDTVYVMTDEVLAMPPDEADAWSYPAPGGVFTGPTLTDELVVVGTSEANGLVVAFER